MTKIQCERTGAVVYLAQYGTAIRCDAFNLSNGVYCFHVVNSSENYCPPDEIVHYVCKDVTKRFDKSERYGTILSDQVLYYGYEGRPLDQLTDPVTTGD